MSFARSGPWTLALALAQSQIQGSPKRLDWVNRLNDLAPVAWRASLGSLRSRLLRPASGRGSMEASMRLCCDGFRLAETWREALAMFGEFGPRFGGADAYSCCEALRACISGHAWTLSLALLENLNRSGRQSQSLGMVLALRACSWARQWKVALRLLCEVRLRHLETHVGMYDASLFSILPPREIPRNPTASDRPSWASKKEAPRSKLSKCRKREAPWQAQPWPWASSLLEACKERGLRRNPFMLQAALRGLLEAERRDEPKQENEPSKEKKGPKGPKGPPLWCVSLELLLESLANSLEAHWNHFAAAARGLRGLRSSPSEGFHAWKWAARLLADVAARCCKTPRCPQSD